MRTNEKTNGRHDSAQVSANVFCSGRPEGYAGLPQTTNIRSNEKTMCAEGITDKKRKGAANGCGGGRENITVSKSSHTFSVEVEGMKAVCPLGEVVGNKMIAEGRIPVISCEGGCFRGEIARMAAHIVAKEEPYSRGCHGEMFTAPRSAMTEWAKKAGAVVVIDGCFMHCHGRIMKNIVGDANMIQFDALPMYNKGNKYSNTMLVDEIPEAERKDLARQVAAKVLAGLRDCKLDRDRKTPHKTA